MSVPSASADSRRLSSNTRNAYVIITSKECETSNTNKNKKVDDSQYLTAKPANRVRYLSDPTSERILNSDNRKAEASTVRSPVPVVENIKTSATRAPIQVGMDRYVTVLKRVRSPVSSNMIPRTKISKNSEKPNSNNRFALLSNEAADTLEAPRTFKPPPIYLRENNSNEVVKCLVSLIGENSFYVSPIKRGNIKEVKVQVNQENDYRKVVANFESRKKDFYTYQLKSGKGLQIVIKGIDSCVPPTEVKESLIDKGFKVKNVHNIRNKDKVPQPMFRVELEPGDIKLKKNETHPIYDLKYLLHRKIIVEEPLKRTGPVQCLNCQEFGHTKAYCKLPSVCVVCGELHDVSMCDKSKEDSKAKKCSNCGGNHTANYRGCPVYGFVKQSTTRKPEVAKVQPKPATIQNHPIPQPVTSQFSYADILKTSQTTAADASNKFKANPNPSLSKLEDTGFNFSRLESTIENLVQTTNTFTNTMSNMMNNFTNSMTNMMTEILRVQQMLLQAVLNKP